MNEQLVRRHTILGMALCGCENKGLPLVFAPIWGSKGCLFETCWIAMAKGELLDFPVVVTELLPNAMFRVKLENEHQIIAHAGRTHAENRIRVLAGDKVLVEMTSYDLAKVASPTVLSNRFLIIMRQHDAPCSRASSEQHDR
jgi:translation initiation factor IF-1